MTFDYTQINASKRKFRQNLATADITEKLYMLDALRERALVLRPHPFTTEKPKAAHDNSPPYPLK